MVEEIFEKISHVFSSQGPEMASPKILLRKRIFEPCFRFAVFFLLKAQRKIMKFSCSLLHYKTKGIFYIIYHIFIRDSPFSSSNKLPFPT